MSEDMIKTIEDWGYFDKLNEEMSAKWSKARTILG